tara:strand:+ start:1361 stop:2038 length:678 start_codon:yes stop_codon:yes gene_type:complete
MSYSTTGTISEVLIGTGVLYIKDASTTSLAFPGDNSNDFDNPTAMTVAWDQIGYSEDGWTMEVDKTFEDVMVAEELDPIKTLKSAQEVRLTGELAQASLTNFAYAMGGGSTASGELGAGNSGAAGTSVSGYHTFKPPTSDEFTEYALILHTDGQAGSDRQFWMPRTVNTGSFSMAHQKAPNKVTLATEFKLLVPDNLSVGSDAKGNKYLFVVVENRNDSDELDIN